MNYKLIMFDNPIIVSDEKLEKEQWFLTKENLVHNNFGWNYGDRKVIAGIPSLPSIDFSALSEADQKKVGWVDVNSLAIEEYKFNHKSIKEIDFRLGFISGFKAAQSLNEKKFSINDVIEFHKWLRKKYGTVKPFEEGLIVEKCSPEELVSKFLSQPKIFDIEVKMENKMALDGHTVIGTEPKITNNSIKVIKIL